MDGITSVRAVSVAVLLRAVQADDAQLVVRLLVAQLFDVNDADETGLTMLIFAANLGRTDLVRLLLARRDVDVNKATSAHLTALMCASINGHVEAVRLLLARQGVEVNKATLSGVTALMCATQNGHVDVVGLLLASNGVEVNKGTAGDGATALIVASKNGSVEMARLLLASKGVEVNKASTPYGFTALIVASENGHVEVVRLLLARQGVEVNKATLSGATALIIASQNGHIEVARLLLASRGVEVNKTTPDGFTALIIASENGRVEVVRLLLAHPGVKTGQTSAEGWSALGAASRNGHGAIVSLLVAHRAHEQVLLLAADAIDSLPADLIKVIPGYAAQVAALRLPLDVAAALGDTEEERAAAYVLASQSASLEAANVQLASAAVQTPEELSRAREALANEVPDAAAHAAREREVDAALRAATTTTAFRLAQTRQLIVRKILFSRFDALVRGAQVSEDFAASFSAQRLEEFKLAQAESAARFALRHNGQEPADRLLGATRALAAAITALVAERAERDMEKLFADAAAMSISPQPVTLSACSAESGATTSAASSGSSAGAPGAGERRRCAGPGCPNGGRTKCSACKSVEYCSRACQKLHWAAHKAACKVTSPGSMT